jgi:uncharacterized membrane protein
MDPLETIKVILGLLLVLFIPGFALSWALFPERSDISDIERLAYSFVLSLLSVMLGVLFVDTKLGLEVNTLNIAIVIGLIVAFSLLAYCIQVIMRKRGVKQNILGWVSGLRREKIKEYISSKVSVKKFRNRDNKKKEKI